jgi:hypothetical protein
MREQMAGSARTAAVRAGAVLALLCCIALVLVNWALAVGKCSFDTSYCAESHEKDHVYTGVLKGRPHTRFTIAFASRRGERDVGGFATDARGRYCFLWAREDIVPYIHPDAGATIPARSFRPLEESAPPARCQTGDAGIPWDRAEPVSDAWQSLTVPLLAMPACVLLFLAAISRDVPLGRGLLRGGLVVTGATSLLFVLLWFT